VYACSGVVAAAPGVFSSAFYAVQGRGRSRGRVREVWIGPSRRVLISSGVVYKTVGEWVHVRFQGWNFVTFQAGHDQSRRHAGFKS
jgi:hypothetical protein